MNGAADSTAWVVRAQRMRSWGMGLLLLAGLSWAYLAFQMFTPYETGRYGNDCDAPAFRDHAYENCEAERPWTTMMGLLAASVPLGMLGMGLYTSGNTTLQVREYVAGVMVAHQKSAHSATSDASDASATSDASDG